MIQLLWTFRTQKGAEEKMIQDIEPYVYNNAYDPKAPDKDSFVLYCGDVEVGVGDGGKGVAVPAFGGLEKVGADGYEGYT